MKLKAPFWYLLAAPFVIYYAGIGLNFLAVTMNQGVMPFIPSLMMYQQAIAAGFNLYPGMITDPIHKVMSSTDHLKLICDWIQIPGEGVASPGDICIWLGDALKLPGMVAYIVSVIHSTL